MQQEEKLWEKVEFKVMKQLAGVSTIPKPKPAPPAGPGTCSGFRVWLLSRSLPPVGRGCSVGHGAGGCPPFCGNTGRPPRSQPAHTDSEVASPSPCPRPEEKAGVHEATHGCFPVAYRGRGILLVQESFGAGDCRQAA